MSEEKQIEEMKSIIDKAEEEYSELWNEWFYNHKEDMKIDHEFLFFAKAIYNAGYRNASEVAREIFAEIENVINNELQNNCKVLPQFEFSNELWNKVSGRIEALKEICDFIAELKKKYTEDKNG